MEFLLSIFKCLSNEGLVGLQSIQYIFFLSFILFEYPELIKNQNNTFIDILSNKLNDIYSSNSIIVDFDINKITTKICNLIDLSDFNNIKKSTLLNDIFNLHLNNEN